MLYFNKSFSIYLSLALFLFFVQHSFKICLSSPISVSNEHVIFANTTKEGIHCKNQRPNNPRPNILFFIVDDLRSTLGGIKGIDDANGVLYTPNIAKLVNEGGTLFNHAYAQIALCAPSRNSFLTGRRPDTTLAYQFVDHFRELGVGFEWTTLPELFKKNGYVSVGAGKVFHPDLPPHWDLPRSWDERMSSGVWDTWMYPTEKRCGNNASWCAVEKDDEIQDLEDYKTTQVILEMLRNISTLNSMELEGGLRLEKMKKKSSKEQQNDNEEQKDKENYSEGRNKESQNTSAPPFFIAAGFRKPHLQWKFPKYILDKFYPSIDDVDNRIPLPGLNQRAYPRKSADLGYHMPVDDFLLDFNDVKNCSSADFAPSFSFSKECIKKWRMAYFASVTWVDACIGQIIDELEKLNLKENTIIALVGDHGWHLGNYGMYEKFSNFDVAVRTPLIFGKLPPKVVNFLTPSSTIEHDSHSRQSQTAQLVEDIVELIDIYPTLARIAGLDLPTFDTAPLDGKSLHRYLLPESAKAQPTPKSSSSLSFPCNSGSSSYKREINDSLQVGENSQLLFEMNIDQGIALSQFPRCLNGLNYNTILREHKPLSDMNRLTFEVYNNGTIPTYRKPTVGNLPLWKLTNCNGVKREDFTYMGLSMRTKQYRLTNWYLWRGYEGVFEVNWDIGPIEQELYIHQTDPMQDIYLDANDFETNNVAKEAEYQTLLKYLNELLEQKFRRNKT